MVTAVEEEESASPPIRRVRSQILLYLIKPVPWVEVYLVMPYVFVTEESTLQVKTGFRVQPWEHTLRSGKENSI
jgi:hypothetical protein